MKKLILLFTIAMSFSAQAQQPANCDNIAKVAHVIMETRQAGASMSQIFEVNNGNTVLNYMTTRAFETSRLMRSVEQKRAAVDKFENLMFLTCHKLNELNKGK